MTAPPKKLIEVALPLDAINKASAREKSIRHGHPSTLHLWWARRPLAAARAVIFAQMADDPSEYADELLADPATRRKAEEALQERLAAWQAKQTRTDDAADTESLVGDAADTESLVGEAAGTEPSVGEAADTEPAMGEAAGAKPTLEEAAADVERARLFGLLEELVTWENTTNEAVLARARKEIRRSWRRTCQRHADDAPAATLFDPDRLPAFHDPFAGGGAIPLEAQRLGLEAHASDLNPVAVLINKAMIEIPPRFADRAPANPQARADGSLLGRTWKGAQGLAEDVRYYGEWMREEAARRIGHLYPKVEVTAKTVLRRPDLKRYEGRKLTVIAWLWARTVKSPNPAFAEVEVPLCSTFMLSTKKGKEAYVEPVIEGRGYRFEARTGAPEDLEAAKKGTKLARGANFKCLMSEMPMAGDYIKAEGKAGRMGARLMAIVAEGDRGRVYLSPTKEHEAVASQATPEWEPDVAIPPDRRSMFTPLYGLTHFKHLFTSRQLTALTTFSDLVAEAAERAREDFLASERDAAAALSGKQDGPGAGDVSFPAGASPAANAMPPFGSYAGNPQSEANARPLREGGNGARAYAEAVGVYLAFAISKVANIGSSITSWMNDRSAFRETFARQAIPMVWDYAEANPFTNAGGSLDTALEKGSMVINEFPALNAGSVKQLDAADQTISTDKMISTDPPYYDNIGYADLSDFFYVWMRRSLKSTFPDLFSTLAVPKAQELVATPYRHGSKDQAETFFLDGMTHAMRRLTEQAHPAFPVTIYYAFKQAERKGKSGTASTGWETFLDAVIRSGFSVTGTWPVRTESSGRILGQGTNALASSIVLVCRRRPQDAPLGARREFSDALRKELPAALAHLQSGNIAPVDLAQAAIGPGMAVFTRYARVLHTSGETMTVREALAMINEVLDEALREQEGDFDRDSRWALAWFEQHGFAEGAYGAAETLSKAKNTSIAGIVEGGILVAKEGKARLLRPDELSERWDPLADERLSVWEAAHHLVRALETGGEMAAAEIVRRLGGVRDAARELAYRLYALCERKKRPAEALSYNALVQSWPEIARLARQDPTAEQGDMFGERET